MILLIAGPPRCGKTTLAQRISKRTNISWISADSISGIAKATVEALPGSHTHYLEKAYPKVEMRKDTNNSNDQMYTKYTSEEIVNAYTTEAEACHPGIKALIQSFLVEGHDFIIEGYQLTPKLLNEVSNEEVFYLTLVRSDRDKLTSDLPKNVAKNDWAIQKTDNDEIYPLIADMIVEFSNWYKKECEKYDLECVDVGDNFKESIQDLAKDYSLQFKT